MELLVPNKLKVLASDQPAVLNSIPQSVKDLLGLEPKATSQPSF